MKSLAAAIGHERRRVNSMDTDVILKHIRSILSKCVPSPYETMITRMKFFIEPEISCSRFFRDACFSGNGEKTELGSFVANHLADGLFVDIPCGLRSPVDPDDAVISPLAAELGAKTYWEVDVSSDVLRDRIPSVADVIQNGHYMLSEQIGEIGIRSENGMQVATMQDDVLGFIAKLSNEPRSKPMAIYISALQPDAEFCAEERAQQEVIVPYLTALFDELARVCTSKDLVILNSSTMLVAGIDEDMYPFIHPAIALPQRGFLLMRRCPYDKVHVFAKQ